MQLAKELSETDVEMMIAGYQARLMFIENQIADIRQELGLKPGQKFDLRTYALGSIPETENRRTAPSPDYAETAPAPKKRKKHRISLQGRKAIAAAQRKRWAHVHAAGAAGK